MRFCGWPVEIPASLKDAWDALDEDVQERAAALAGQILWTLTGRVYGVCDSVARPCMERRSEGTTYRGEAGFWPGLLNGAPWASGPCGCSDGCREVSYDRVALPGPVAEIDEVLIDGITIDPATYRLDKRRWLHRIDGQRWPTHQDLHAADDEVGAFTVRFKRGIPIPDPGPVMAGVLAVEFARGMTGAECRLPDRATSASRQGISVELTDPRAWFTEGLTGIEEVDLWILAMNPGRSRRPASLTSPDHLGGRR